jgi:hypothetical protein
MASGSDSYLGRGWSFPPSFSNATQDVAMLEAEADVASSLHILLSTLRGERVMRPTYGCGMDELLFESLDTRMKTLMRDKIEAAILYHEPRVKVESVALDDDEELQGIVLIEITYAVKSTNSRFNFVYPFYREEGTDLNLSATFTLLSRGG